MQPENKYNNDLDYLSEQGFEKITVDDSDLHDLKKRMRAKTFSLKRFYGGAVSLVLGLVVGALLSVNFGNKNTTPVTTNTSKNPDESKREALSLEEKITSLDTVFVVNENFVDPVSVTKKPTTETKNETFSTAPSAEVLVSRPLSLSANGELEEKQLRYINNSPLFYLHDLKITNYTTLYFKKHHFVKFTGLSAAYANKNELAPAGSSLKQNAEAYLHEEIAKALLYFKKGNYDQAILSLKTVATYNKEDLNCDFYLAMSYYYKKNYNEAIAYFDACSVNVNNTFLQEALYYKAVSLHEKGNTEEAKLLFNKIVDANAFYASKASEYLNR